MEILLKEEKKISHSRIFLLTDGEVQNRDSCISRAKTGNEEIRLHTFGIGGQCDKEMVINMAKQGRGSCSLIDNIDKLKPLVIRSLKKATQPSLKNCQLKFGNKTIDYGEVFCGEVLQKSAIMTEDEFS